MNRAAVTVLAALFAVAGAGLPAEASQRVRMCDDRVVTIMGTKGADRLVGTDGPDVIWSGRGADIVTALGGDDHVCSGRGADEVFGGAGLDRLRGGPAEDSLRGGADRDLIFGGGAADELDGGDGPDTLYGDWGDDVLLAASDTGTGGCVDDFCDYLIGGQGDDLLDGGTGTAPDSMFYSGERDMRINLERGISRGEGRDALISIEAVHMQGGSGLADSNDRIVGSAATNGINSGYGHDVIIGRGGDDYLGESGDLQQDGAGDVVRGGPGADRINTIDADDQVWGGSGDDDVRVEGSTLGDGQQAHLGPGNDVLELRAMGPTPVRAWGGRGNDWIWSTGYRSRLHGGSGDDQLATADGDDWIFGGTGQDAGTGGLGHDTCIAVEMAEECEASP